MSGSKAFDWKLFVVLAVINFAAVVLNHIDDTDETYGYWEPLHYLLYGKGMQTWEYDPVFAIRSYAFIFPLFLVGNVLRKLGVEKIALFYCLRGIIGLFSTYSQYTFLSSLSRRYGKEPVAAKHNLRGLVAIFLLLSPGVFFASTSFLPSAFSMTLTMLSVARWLDGLLLESIFWGSLAVLGTGWPFVGLIFLPLGLHMLVHSYQIGGFMQIIKLCISGLVVVSLVLLPVTAIDFIYYDEP